MNKIKTAVDLLRNNRGEFVASLVENCSFLFPDKAYLSIMFKYRMGYSIDWSNPKSYSEKLQWLKLYDRNPLYTTLVDKYEVKKYVSEKIGDQYIAKLLGVWDTPNQIDYDLLPDKFVLKTTHGGGNCGVVICKDKSSLDIQHTQKELESSMKYDLYKDSREWPYKNVKRRIIAEEYLEDAGTKELRDYKFFCFDGKVKALFVATERQTRKEPFFNFFDENYNVIDVKQGHPRAEVPPVKPTLFEEMKMISEKLSKGLPHVRVDLYEANGRVYFGELTFYHFGGMVPFEPSSWDETFGSWLHLPTSNK